MREISITLVLNFGNDPSEPYSDSELLEAIIESMTMEPIEIETPNAETTFEIFGGRLNG